MSYVPGNNYPGLTNTDYQTLMSLNNTEITNFLSTYFSSVNGGQYWVLDPSINQLDDEYQEFFEALQDAGCDGYITYFTYLKSTWAMSGF